MGKHDAATPMAEALEMHYKDKIRELEIKLSQTTTELEDAKLQIRQLRQMMETQEGKVDEYRDALLDTILEASRARRKGTA